MDNSPSEIVATCQEQERYFNEYIDKIPGWADFASIALTSVMMEEQDKLDIPGNVLELGIYHGRYLAHLYKCAQPKSRAVIGIDGFFGSKNIADSIAYIRANIKKAAGENDRLLLHCADTLTLTRNKILSLSKEKFSYISIDAGHECRHLLNDLALCSGLLEKGGIIALDDAFNPKTSGVSEGIHTFMIKKNSKLLKFVRALVGRDDMSLAPFAYSGNKLFVTTLSHQARYLNLAKIMAQALEEKYEYARNTCIGMRDRERDAYVTKLWGYEILPFY